MVAHARVAPATQPTRKPARKPARATTATVTPLRPSSVASTVASAAETSAAETSAADTSAPHEPADVLLPDTDTSDEVGSTDPGDIRFNVELVLANPSTHGDPTVTLQLPARQIRALLDQTTQWVRLPEHPHYLQHPQGQTRYINVLNGVQEILVYGDWTPGEE